MEDAYKIIGGKPLRGNVTLSGAKNVALKTIIAALLFKDDVILHNIPRINDVVELLHILNDIGAEAAFIDSNTVKINAQSMRQNKVDMLHASKIRASFLLFAPLLHHFETCFVPNPGGCRIGARPIDRIIEGMKYVGVDVEYDSSTGYYHASLQNEIHGEYTFSKPTHTGTELLIMLAVLSSKKTILSRCALEPEIDELIHFLNDAGAHIVREHDTIIVEGVSQLLQKNPFTISSDRNEAVTFAVLGTATKGDILIENVIPESIDAFLRELREAGGVVELTRHNAIRFYHNGNLRATHIQTSPHPGFMTDWQPNWAVLMTQAEGESTIHERVFENRFAYVSELRKLGAKIDFISPSIANPQLYYYFTYSENSPHQQAIRITGPTTLHNGVIEIHDLRAGASLIIASLVASGESVVEGASIVERGYENLVEKLKNIGADISKV